MYVKLPIFPKTKTYYVFQCLYPLSLLHSSKSLTLLKINELVASHSSSISSAKFVPQILTNLRPCMFIRLLCSCLRNGRDSKSKLDNKVIEILIILCSLLIVYWKTWAFFKSSTGIKTNFQALANGHIGSIKNYSTVVITFRCLIQWLRTSNKDVQVRILVIYYLCRIGTYCRVCCTYFRSHFGIFLSELRPQRY